MTHKSDNELRDMLSTVPLFACASKKQLGSIASAGKITTWKEGKVGVVEGATAAAFFLILSGGVQVSRDGKPVARLHENDYFGETAVMTGNPRNASVTATSDTVLFVLSRFAFAGTVKNDPDLAMQMLATMAERNRSAT